jgi:hypothetical protein
MPEINTLGQENRADKDLRELQDKALETPGYSDDPHIESSNRSPKNEKGNDESDVGDGSEMGSSEDRGGRHEPEG